MKVFDAHVHVFPEKIAEKATKATGDYYNLPLYSVGTVENVLKEIESGTLTKCLIHSTATKKEQVEPVNIYISDVLKEHSEFVGFGTMHPDYEDIGGLLSKFREMGLLGIKLHPDFQNFAIDDEKAFAVYENAAKQGLPILFHVGDKKSDLSHPRRLLKVHEKFPSLKIIAAHLGGYSVWEEGEKYLSGKDIYMDLSEALEFMPPEKVKGIIERHGTDKVLFASDFPLNAPGETLRLFYEMGFSEEEEKDILYRNAERLLGIEI